MNFELTVPSIYDGTELQCRIELPAGAHQDDDNPSPQHASWKPKAAIIGHPYAPLGGDRDDHVVRLVARELLRLGYVVGTFNFRGAGQSQGKTSWTGKGEVGDYTSVCLVVMETVARMVSKRTPAMLNISEFEDMDLILAGYSYGSMIASNLPSRELLTKLFLRAHRQGDQSEDIADVQQSMHEFMHRLTSMDDSKISTKDSVSGPRAAAISVSYLLISPILPPVSSFTTLSFLRPHPDLSFTTSNGMHIASTNLDDKVRQGHRVLALFGDNDKFSGVTKLRKWAARLQTMEGSRFDYRETEGGSHFWTTQHEREALRTAVREWCSTPTDHAV